MYIMIDYPAFPLREISFTRRANVHLVGSYADPPVVSAFLCITYFNPGEARWHSDWDLAYALKLSLKRLNYASCIPSLSVWRQVFKTSNYMP